MSDVYSVVLCSNSPLITQELEEVMKGLQTSLKLFVSNPYVLPGGGLTEFLLAQYFKERIKYDPSVLSILDLSNELDLVTKTLESLSKTLTNNTNLLLEEYVDMMKDVNKTYLSVITNEVAKYGQLRMLASFSEIPCNSIVDNEAPTPLVIYKLEKSPKTNAYFTTYTEPKQNMIIDIGLCKKNAIQSSFQCFGTIIQ
ncbi:McKusick-Kaufman/Bardet-Biedl syndromes chaperonin [Naegleria gruberi]|uniref:McKusick-Kaufman/Bardet-Biedl syndromes chaperonin n=1 Tax=Naegleria gruberi TaxID=5762 RepID=D2VKD0_NAEGR|nr:McKusick-Kaufman/Bardet-Biedl syndromes chaperonin [Naegleria gruberi]EFC42663.1 McKusick-Kaufman/Bardet-Biedl syndromes chaperonin [Naegleria gruberi]|eukprot:XP_002675407.1 McKusick-Kaufman/Bardet-Biedl syndromes chaperonin [Naegleria gruberi strain NEG-M]